MIRTLLRATICLLLTPAFSTHAAQTRDEKFRDNWVTTCDKDSCRLRHIIPSGGAAPQKQEVWVEFDFERASGEPTGLYIRVPADADPKAGVQVEFADLPARGSDTRPPRKPLSFTVVITDCDKQGCTAATGNGPTKREIQTYFMENFSAYPFFGISYEPNNGERPLFMEMTKIFNQDYQTLLAELKKPQ